VTALPRFVIAAPASNQGKTTVATGLMAALRRTGLVVSGHKVGPDYIDPGYHALATGRPGRNLDPHLVGEERVAPLLLHGSRGAEVAVIEGVMGLFDGRIGGDGFASTAHVATLTRSPVVLVVDISRSSRSVGAVVHGMATYDPGVRIAAVILNKAGSPRHATEAAASISLPVLGTIPREVTFATPSRHLGLVPAAERDEADEVLGSLASRVAEAVDLDELLRVAGSAPELEVPPWDPVTEVRAPSERRPVVAVAGGRAFTFRYTETEELLRAAGCEVVTFDPMTDSSLPAETAGIYLGGGFPEVHASALSANASLRQDLAAAVAAGTPTVAECAGLLYLAAAVDGQAMVGALPVTAALTERLTLRYPVAVAASDSLLTRAGEQVTGHEFHRTQVDPTTTGSPAWTVDGADMGFATEALHASYLHTHWAGHPQLAQRFADAVHAATPHTTSTGTPSTVSVAEPLQHHGDVEAAPGMTDFAVNVYAGPPPEWLDRALRAGLDRVGRYPDPRAAAEAIARHHDRRTDEALPTSGAAEAFTLVARLRDWQLPVMVHPQFTEPHAALVQAGHRVIEVHCDADRDFRLDPAAVPEAADLVVVGNPTNPTGVLHPAATIKELLRPGRLVVVDEAFMDAVIGETETLTGQADPGLVVVRSLTKHWGIPGVRAGYLLADPDVVAKLRREQVPWSVGSTALAALVACTGAAAGPQARQRAEDITRWRARLVEGLTQLGIRVVPSAASFVLARVGVGVYDSLRARGIAVRRADTFPGLDSSWVRIAVRDEEATSRLLEAMSHAWRLAPGAWKSAR
jgi:cobyrinic acid a,c-diamide synthase